MPTPFIAWLFQGIPETIALAALVVSMSTRELPWEKIVKIGVLQAIVSYVVRLLPFTPGVHVLVNITVLGVLAIYLGKIDMKKALVFSAVSMAILILIEFTVANFLVTFGVFTLEELTYGNLPRIILGYPHTIVLLVLAVFFARKRINLDFLFNKNS